MELSQLAVPSVYTLIVFLGYPSQWLLMCLEPAPLTKNELVVLNVAIVLVLITYSQAVFVDPGNIEAGWAENQGLEAKKGEEEREGGVKSRKWCRRCDAAKPPRAHHCKECKRYASDVEIFTAVLICNLYMHPFHNILANDFQDAYRKWTTTAPGLQIASPTRHSPTFYVSSSTPHLPSLSSRLSSSPA